MAARATSGRLTWLAAGVIVLAACGENAGNDLVEGVDTSTTEPTAATEPAATTEPTGAGSSTSDPVPGSTSSTTAPSPVSTTTSGTSITSAVTTTTTDPPTSTSAPTTVPVATGELSLTLSALPRDQARASVRIMKDGIDQLPRHCTIDSSVTWVTGVVYDCPEMPVGDYEVVAPGFGDVQPVTRCRIGLYWEPRPNPTIAPVGGQKVWCFVAAYPLGVRVSLDTNTIGPPLDGSFEPDGRIDPSDVIVRMPDGADVDVTCRSAWIEGDEWADCSPLPAGRYEVFYPPTPDGERPVVCARGLGHTNGPGLGRFVDLDLGLTEHGVPNVYWSCVNELPFDELKAGMQIIVEAPPGDVDEVVPQLLLNGVDAFPDHCSLSSEYRSWEGGVTYSCEGLEQTVYEVRAPGLYGRQPTFSCLGVGIYDDWLARPDLSVDQFAYCRIDATPPGIRLAIVDIAPITAPFVADQVVLLDESGDPVEVDCVGTSEEYEAWVHCFPMELGRYTVPDQVIDGAKLDPFICTPDVGIGAGPDSTNIVVLADEPEPHGINPLHWTCHNERMF